MNDQKIDNMLNLALNVSEEERRKSVELAIGYDALLNTWDLIIKYGGNLSEITEVFPEIQVVELLNEYAIITIPEYLIVPFSNLSQVEYIEKPKSLYFSVAQAKAASCMTSVQTGTPSYKGNGVIVAVIDSGIDYSHPDFRNPDGTTRILSLWDQTVSGNPPEHYQTGTEFTREQINEALAAQSEQERLQIVPSEDISGHGTAVAGIAAGNGRASDGRNAGVASESDLIIVKMGTSRYNSFPRTTELMLGIDYVIRKSIALGMPIAINLSFGNTYGSHSGDSLLETYIDDVTNLGRTTIAIGTGNEGYAGGHTSGVLSNGTVTDVAFAVGSYETTMSLQIWKNFYDSFAIEILAPNGTSSGVLREVSQTYQIDMGNTELLIYYGEPSPYSVSQEIFIDFIPYRSYIDSGIWTVRLTPIRIIQGNYNMWLPSSSILNPYTRFLFPTPDTTLTIPSTAFHGIAVGAYDSRYQTYADFSGRGYTRSTNLVKPDIAAPGVNILTAEVGGGYAVFSGTSFATPFVTGSAAILMEIGIIIGVDPYLYGEKVKAYLIRGAKHIASETVYPNPRIGYGVLCLEDSLP